MHSISLQQSITWLRYGRFGRERCARLLLWFPGPRSLRSPSWLIGTVMMTCTSLCNCECDRAVPRAARWRAAHSGPPAVSRPLVCQRRFASWLSCGGPCTAEARAILLLTLLVMWGMGLLIGAFVSVAVHILCAGIATQALAQRWHCKLHHCFPAPVLTRACCVQNVNQVTWDEEGLRQFYDGVVQHGSKDMPKVCTCPHPHNGDMCSAVDP